MATARAETGLDGFGPEDFVERLAALCQAMRDEGGFNGAGIMQQHVLLVGLLKNRLLIEDLVRRHPEIIEEQITAPIIICGLPRTGTTHLHNLMSADPTLRSLPYWESLEPVLDEREQPAPGAPDPRLERTAVALSFLNTALPYFNRMHEMTVEHAHEEIRLLAIDFSTMLFETTAPMPAWPTPTSPATSGPPTPTSSKSSRSCSGCAGERAGSSRRPSTWSSSRPSSTLSPTPHSSSPTVTRSRSRRPC